MNNIDLRFQVPSASACGEHVPHEHLLVVQLTHQAPELARIRHVALHRREKIVVVDGVDRVDMHTQLDAIAWIQCRLLECLAIEIAEVTRRMVRRAHTVEVLVRRHEKDDLWTHVAKRQGCVTRAMCKTRGEQTL